jgi:hypothetical protein
MMNERDRILAESALRIAVVKNYERELREYNSVEGAETERVHFSGAHDIRMRRVFRRERARRAARKARAAAYKTAVAASFAIALLALAAATSGGVRAAVRGLIVQWYEQFTNFTSESAGESADTVMWAPGYIPEGFAEVSSDFSDEYSEIRYENENGTYINFSAYVSGNSSISVDNEHSEYRLVVRDGAEYHVFKAVNAESMSNIIWTANSYDFHMSSGIGADELLEIALSVAPRAE